MISTKKIIVILLVISATLSAAPPTNQDYGLSWHDEFSGTELNSDYWTPDLSDGNGTYIPGENAGYTVGQWQLGWKYLDYAKHDNVAVENGYVRLTAKRDDIDYTNPDNGWSYHYDYSSGWMNSLNKKEYHFGYLEARIKFPIGDKAWPAFWTIAADLHWPPEIDIAEYFGSWSDDATAGSDSHGTDNMHNGLYNEKSEWVSYHAEHYWTDLDPGEEQWITWGLDWQKDYLKFYRNDTLLFSITSEMSPIPNEPMYIVLDNGVNFYPEGRDGNQEFPYHMYVDWIRLYKKGLPTIDLDSLNQEHPLDSTHASEDSESSSLVLSVSSSEDFLSDQDESSKSSQSNEYISPLLQPSRFDSQHSEILYVKNKLMEFVTPPSKTVTLYSLNGERMAHFNDSTKNTQSFPISIAEGLYVVIYK